MVRFRGNICHGEAEICLLHAEHTHNQSRNHKQQTTQQTQEPSKNSEERRKKQDDTRDKRQDRRVDTRKKEEEEQSTKRRTVNREVRTMNAEHTSKKYTTRRTQKDRSNEV